MFFLVGLGICVCAVSLPRNSKSERFTCSGVRVADSGFCDQGLRCQVEGLRMEFREKNR